MSDSEKYIAALWSEIVGAAEIGRQSRFQEVGGNSLNLSILLLRIQKETGISLDPQIFLEPETSSLLQVAKVFDDLVDRQNA